MPIDIYSKPGTKIRFSGEVTQYQINCGSHDDPSGILTPGQEYTVDETEVHSGHTIKNQDIFAQMMLQAKQFLRT